MTTEEPTDDGIEGRVEQLDENDEELIREVARQEAREVYDIDVQDGNGKNWSLFQIVDTFGITRRNALAAMGLMAIGYTASGAVLEAISGDAEAATGDAGQIGTPSDRPDFYGDTGNFNSVSTESELKVPVFADNADAVQENRSLWYNDGSGPNTSGYYSFDNGTVTGPFGSGGGSSGSSEWEVDGSGNLVPIDGEPIGDGTTSANHQSVSAGNPQRNIVSRQSVTVSVDTGGGADYTTIQDAIDENISVLQQNDLTVNINSGTYAEDVTIPAFLLSAKPNDSLTPALTITGDVTNPANVVVDSVISHASGKRPVVVEGVEFRDQHPESDSASVQQSGRATMIVRDCNFSNASANANRALSAYGGGIITKSSVDLGTDAYTHGIVGKDQGAFTSECAGGLSGSVTGNAYWNQNASLFTFDTQDSLSGTVRSDRGPLWEFDSSDLSAGLIFHGPLSIDGVLEVDDFGNIRANGSPIIQVPRQRFDFSGDPGGVGSQQAWLLVDDGTGPFSEGDLYIRAEDSGGTQKDIRITDFSTGSTA